VSRGFVARRLFLSGAAEILCLAGNLAPAAVVIQGRVVPSVILFPTI